VGCGLIAGRLLLDERSINRSGQRKMGRIREVLREFWDNDLEKKKSVERRGK
jgi:hypothetical protein